MANRLAQEKSPYLLQHADNPVDWHPWGEEAFAKAQAEDKPMFLSIGYATCHWCHVMAHESFEDEAVAEKLNREFVSVKVDREERPDVDQIYMTVCQALTGSGGWPLSLFLTPDKKPFFAGTYFPPSGQMGHPGFGTLLDEIARLWKEDRQRILDTGDQITQAIRPKPAAGQASLDEKTLEKAYWMLDRSFDEKRGGFGQAPKFPTPHQLTFLLRWHLRHRRSRALAMVEKTLTAMRHGGIFDQVGLGFHRYSVDQRWLAPHFEKMLYDQALLALAYLEAFQLTKKEVFAQAAREIFTYVLRDMTAPQGGFYSAEDADSEGVEGLFYVWTPDQVREVLGDELGGLFCRFYDITGPGNFEHGRSIPWITRDVQTFAKQQNLEPDQVRRDLDQAREKLFAARQKRVPPLKDDKVLTAWNGLMIAALAKGYQVLGDDSYLDAADRAADFILSELGDGEGGLWRRWRDGEKKNPGYLDDYAFMVWGLIELYEAGLDARRLGQAEALQQKMFELFWDEMHHGFYYTPVHGEDLIVRNKEAYDGATPSGNSVSAMNLLRLARLLGRGEWEERAWQVIKAFSDQVAGHPAGFTQFLQALDFALGQGSEIVVAGEVGDKNTQEMLRIVRQDFAPGRVWLLRPKGEAGREVAELAPLCRDMRPVDGAPSAYVCQNQVCQRPLTDPGELAQALAGGD